MSEKGPLEHPETPFNYAIFLYDMNADEVFDQERHLIVDSSLGLVDEDMPISRSGNREAPDTRH